MASLHHHHHHLLLSLPFPHSPTPPKRLFFKTTRPLITTRATVESPTPKRRGRKKKPPPPETPPANDTPEPQNAEAKKEQPSEDDELFDYDDGIDFPYEDPPLVCCYGAARREFIPGVRVQLHPMHADKYSEWKMLQWKPPEFARAPGGRPRTWRWRTCGLGGAPRFWGRTGCSYMKVKFEEGKMKMETVKDSAEDALLASELNLAVLKEARIFHFNSEVLTCPTMESTLFRAIKWTRKFGGLVFFDLNLPLSLWRSRDETRERIKKAWNEADIIEVSRSELEFLLDEEYYERKRNYRPQYFAESYEQTKNLQEYYHYTPEEIAPLWHDRLKFLFVTDGTIRIHYYTPSFDGSVVGTEDVLITPFTCDRTGSGDAIVAAILRKLTTCPEMFENQDVLERQLRFAVAAGIIAQWTIGAIRGFPTESATQNLKEQVYVPSMW
ncbi:hypothetical protein ACSQ67_020495 [Phaseolus vulgaris]